MKPELKKQIIAYNRALREHKKKSSDMDILIAEILKFPPGQLKKVLSPEILCILEKYGIVLE